MASEAQVQAMISAGVVVSEFLRTEGGTAGTNLLGLMQSFASSVGTVQDNYGSEALSGMQQVRGGYANGVDNGKAWFDACLLSYAAVRGFADTDPQLIIRRLYQDFIDNTKRIKSRVFSFGTVTLGGSNVGDGTINRLTEDANTLPIENTWAQTINLRCIRDRNSGAPKHQEYWEIRGGAANPDNILIAGSGRIATLQSLSAANTLGYFQNPSWDLMSGSGVTKFDNWTIAGSASNFAQNATYYRDYVGAPTVSYSLAQSADDTIAQTFALNNTQFDPTTPFYVQVAVNASANAASGGSITLTFGDQSVTVTIASLSAGWNILRLGISFKAWFENFMGTAPTVSLAWASRSSGTLLWDDLVVAPYQNFDGLWYAPVGGPVPFQEKDTASYVDTETGSKIQRFLWQYYGLYLPATTGGGITWADP